MNQIVPAQLAQHEKWREARARVDGAPFVARPHPVVKTIDVRPKPRSAPLPMVRMGPRERDWLIVSALLSPPEGVKKGRRRMLGHDSRWMGIVEAVAAKHIISVKEILGGRREKPVVIARQEAMWRIANETAMNLTAIGRKFDRDHTTVIWSIQRHQARIAAGTA